MIHKLENGYWGVWEPKAQRMQEYASYRGAVDALNGQQEDFYRRQREEAQARKDEQMRRNAEIERGKREGAIVALRDLAKKYQIEIYPAKRHKLQITPTSAANTGKGAE